MADNPPAAWYPDPEDSSQHRYWNGSQWTEHRSPRSAEQPTEATKVLDASPPENAPAKPTPSPLSPTAPPAGSSPPAEDKGKRVEWWQRWWAVVGFAILGLLVGVGIGAGSGGETKTTTEVSTRTQVSTDTVTRTVNHTKTKTVAAQPASTPSGGGGGGGKSFSGNGSKNLGDINVSEDSTLKWTNDGDIFQVFEDEGGIPINSDAHSGDTALPAGSYSNVTVNAIGNWTIKITPG